MDRNDTIAAIATAPGEECDFVSRFFGPAVGVDEDPVTGSAHCALVPYWSARLAQVDPARVYDLPTADQHEHLMEHDETLSVLAHLILPTLTLGLVLSGVFLRLTRINVKVYID